MACVSPCSLAGSNLVGSLHQLTELLSLLFQDFIQLSGTSAQLVLSPC